MDDDALAGALKQGRIRAAALDVHENEPYNVFQGQSAQCESYLSMPNPLVSRPIKVFPLPFPSLVLSSTQGVGR